MRLKIYSVRDAKTDIYNTPFYCLSHGDAERKFTKMVNDNRSMIADFPEDYSLWHLGEYDDNEGKFETLGEPLHMQKAIDVKTIPEKQIQDSPC